MAPLRPALLLAALLGTGCAYPVVASGRIEAAGDEVLVRASNDKARPLALSGEARALRYADGLLVKLEGTLRRGAIEVDAWRVVEGPHGFSAWVGTVVALPDGGVGLAVRDEGGTWTLDGRVADELAAREGELVLVEGIVSGPMRIRGLHWQSMGL